MAARSNITFIHGAIVDLGADNFWSSQKNDGRLWISGRRATPLRQALLTDFCLQQGQICRQQNRTVSGRVMCMSPGMRGSTGRRSSMPLSGLLHSCATWTKMPSATPQLGEQRIKREVPELLRAYRRADRLGRETLVKCIEL